MNLDNRITPKVIHVPAEETSAEYCCISCNSSFWVYSQNNYYGTPPNQTLLCGPCLNHLKNCITRERENNYGW